MSFREKRAWISFTILLLVAGIYYAILFKVTHLNPNGPPGIRELGDYFKIAVVLIIGLEVTFYIGFRIISPVDARTPKDEREILIELRATRVAFTVLIILCILAAAMIVHAHGDNHGIVNWGLGNFVLLTIVIAQLTKYAMQIFYYRRES